MMPDLMISTQANGKRPVILYGDAEITICGPDGRALWITIGSTVYYIDDSANEQIVQMSQKGEQEDA
jgi:hypothetical protein